MSSKELEVEGDPVGDALYPRTALSAKIRINLTIPKLTKSGMPLEIGALEQNHRLRFGRFSFAHGTDALGGLELHRDLVNVQLQRPRQSFANGDAVILEL